MGRGAEPRTPFGADLVHHVHERNIVRSLVHLAQVLFHAERRERAERLAVLDARVQDGLHVGPARMADDRSVAESPRSPFLASLEPAEDLALAERVRSGVQQLLAREFLERHAALAHRFFALVVAPARAPVAVDDFTEAGLVQNAVHDVGSSASRRAVVAGRGMDVHAIEMLFHHQPTVGDAVERAPAREHDIAQAPIHADAVLHVLDVDVLEAFLHRERHVLVLLLGRVFASARLSEEFLHRLRPHRLDDDLSFFALVVRVDGVVVVVVLEVEAHSLTGDVVNERLHLVGERVLAVRGQAHHLVFLAVLVESEEITDRRVEHAERVGPEVLVQNFDLVSLAPGDKARAEVARAVGRERRRALELAPEETARGVRDVMFNVVDLGLEIGMGPPAGFRDELVNRRKLAVHLLRPHGELDAADGVAGDETELGSAIGARVTGDGYIGDVAHARPAQPQNFRDRQRREPRAVLLSVDALFRDRGDHALLVVHQHRGSIRVDRVQSQHESHVAFLICRGGPKEHSRAARRPARKWEGQG